MFLNTFSAPVEVIVGFGDTDVSCYTCDNTPDNDECNGVQVSISFSFSNSEVIIIILKY